MIRPLDELPEILKQFTSLPAELSEEDIVQTFSEMADFVASLGGELEVVLRMPSDTYVFGSVPDAP